jgi:hypothetical protein
MSVRRLFGLLTMFVMFHLILVGPGSACAGHGEGGHAMAPSSQSAMLDHAMGHGDSTIPCETPSSAHCCDALTSCSATAALDVPARSLAVLTVARMVPTSRSGQLLSRARAPEPPPPRA